MTVSHENGFMPLACSTAPQPPGDELAPLEALLARLPTLLRDADADALAREVAALPSLDAPAAAAAAAGDSRALHAMLRDLAVLVSAFVLRRTAAGEPRRRVPAALARPFQALCIAAGLPTIMEYSSYCLTNVVHRAGAAAPPLAQWRWQDLRLLRRFDGGPEESTFVAVHAEMEAKGGALVLAYAKLLRALAAAWASAPAAPAGVRTRSRGRAGAAGAVGAVGGAGGASGDARAAAVAPKPRVDVGSVALVVAALHDIKDVTDAIIVSSEQPPLTVRRLRTY
jgi:hypothetical protein